VMLGGEEAGRDGGFPEGVPKGLVKLVCSEVDVVVHDSTQPGVLVRQHNYRK
jgi:hypothetical protein